MPVKKYNKENISMVMDLLGISFSSVSHYIADGVLTPDANHLFHREDIYKKLGIPLVTDEPLIGIKEAAKILKRKEVEVVPTIKRTAMFPYYSFKSGKGAKYYFLRSEIEASLKARFQWDNKFPDFQAKRYFFAEILDGIISRTSGLDETEVAILRAAFIDGSSMESIVDGLGGKLSTQNVRDALARGCKKIKFQIESIMKYHSDNKGLLDELTRLEQENAALRRGLNSQPIIIERVSGDLKNASIRLINVLAQRGVTSVQGLTGIKRSFLERCRNVGKKTMIEADNLLAGHGLKWLGEDEVYIQKEKEKETIKSKS